jgi:hypothetical protein
VRCFRHAATGERQLRHLGGDAVRAAQALDSGWIFAGFGQLGLQNFGFQWLKYVEMG